jgi:hypothetical protein
LRSLDISPDWNLVWLGAAQVLLSRVQNSALSIERIHENVFCLFWRRTKYSYRTVSLHEQTFEFPVAGPCLSIQIIASSFQLSHNWTTDCFLPRWCRTWPGITLLNKMLNRVSLCCSTAVGWTAVRPQEMHTEMVQQEGKHYMRNLQPGRYFCFFCYKVTSHRVMLLHCRRILWIMSSPILGQVHCTRK